MELELESADLSAVMRRDEFRLRAWRERIRRMPVTEREAAVFQWQEVFHRSEAICRRRREGLPQPVLDADLPIFERAQAIRDLLQNHNVVIVSGETGSGKSTQLPLIAMQAGWGVRGLIGHTQPRRLAARGVASRLASQLQTPLGQEVGCKIRFLDQTSPRTYIKLMTDGILLTEIQRDRYLEQYDLLIVDEAHERSLNVDFLLGYLKQILARRQDLKLILTSATMDTQRFAEHFGEAPDSPAPRIEVSGRTYPIDIRYRPPERADEDRSQLEAVVDACDELLREHPGDILVFLPTESEILQAAKLLRGAQLRAQGQPVEILPLYARLSPEQQNAIFEPHARIRIVLATNVAESSLTVPGIRSVVDTGTARISRYAPRSKVQRLPIEPISQASARQRAGRCGRIGPGICLRLYSADDFDSRPEYTTPEIRRTNLASTILQLQTLGLGTIESFPFLDPPHADAIRDGFKTLFELGALDASRRLTPLGRRLARLPVDPRVARMLYAAADAGCLSEVTILAAAMEVPDPRLRPPERIAAAEAAHAAWRDPRSDFLGWLKLWDFVHHLRATTSRSQFRKALQKNFLSQNLITQWQDIHRQILAHCAQEKLSLHPRQDDYNSIHRSLLSGLLSSVALRQERSEYLGAGGIRWQLWPGSGVAVTQPRWIMAAELVETGRRYARGVATIEPAWLEPLAPHLVKRAYVDPHWSAASQTAIGYENVSLFGLPIVSRRRLGLAKVDPEICRQLFLEQGLVENQITSDFPFHRHNRELLENVALLARKTRRRDWLVERYALIAFYESRLPQTAVDVRALQQLLKSDRQLDGRLRLDLTQLGLADPTHLAEHFPDRVCLGSLELPVRYEFQPGATDDGATLRVPLEALGQLDDTHLPWLIPGLLVDRVEALIRGLPKPQRRHLVPAPEVARAVVAAIPYGQGSFLGAVSRELSRLAGEPIPLDPATWQNLPDFLKVNIQVVGANDQILAAGRTLAELHDQLPLAQRPQSVAVADRTWNQDHLLDWTWGALPKQIEIQSGPIRMLAFPAILDQGNGVGLRLVDTFAKAEMETRRGLVRLFRIAHRRSVKSQVAWLPEFDRAAIRLQPWISSEALQDFLADRIIGLALVEGRPVPRSRDEFAARQVRALEEIAGATQAIAKWLPKLGDQAHAARLALDRIPQRSAAARTDLQAQLAYLLAPALWRATDWNWLQHLPRYLQAMTIRIDKLTTADGKADQQHQRTIDQFEERAAARREQQSRAGQVSTDLEQFGWLLQELRVSLFAQQLGTSQPVSEKRLSRLWDELQL